MLRKSTFALLVMLILIMAVAVTAQEAQEKTKEITSPIVSFMAVSPQAKDGVIPAKDSFTVDLVLNYSGPKDLTGGSFGVQFYSPDKSLKSVVLRTVDTTAKEYGNIEFIDGWKKAFDALNMINLDKPFGYNGVLPDSTYFVFAGIKGYATGQGPQAVIRFNLKAEGPGKLCVDSVGRAGDDLEWLFPEGYQVSFEGPYCWEIK
jgi:hypothetical protein